MKIYLHQVKKTLRKLDSFAPLAVSRYLSPLKALGIQFSALVFQSVENIILTGLKVDVEVSRRCELSIYGSICLGDDDTAACLSVSFFFLRFFIGFGCLDYPPIDIYPYKTSEHD